MSTEWPWAGEFEPEGTYLNSATMGLPPRATLAALATALDEWRRGTAFAPGYDADVAAAVRRTRGLVGVPPRPWRSAARCRRWSRWWPPRCPTGATVLVPEGEFTSVTFPFLAQEARGIRVVEVPLAEIAEHVDGSTGLVALAAAQSSDGAVAPAGRRGGGGRAARGRRARSTSPRPRGGCRWTPGRFAYTVCARVQVAARHRGAPRSSPCGATGGTRLVPAAAGWYAGEQPWSSIYGTPLRLASDARRYDVSPGWHAWVGTASSLALLERVGVAALHAHALAGRGGLRRRGAGLEPAGRAIRALAADDEVPAAAGRARRSSRRSGRAGSGCPSTSTTPRTRPRGSGHCSGGTSGREPELSTNGEDLCRGSHLGLCGMSETTAPQTRPVLDVVAIDCPDAAALADFYAGILGWEVKEEPDDDWVTIAPAGAGEGSQALAFQEIGDYVAPTWPGGAHPQQFHLDLRVPDLATGEAQVLAAGATPARAPAVHPGRLRRLPRPGRAPVLPGVMSAPAIEAVDLVKKFDDFTAVDGVSFTVPTGTVFSMLGPNGAGKTTTVRMMTTLSIPTSGTARVAGFDVVAEPGCRAPPDGPDRPVRDGRRAAHRPREPPADR